MKYKISEYAKLNHVTYRTVWNWIKEGKLETERSTTGRIQIVVDEATEKTVAIYARVSSSENKDTLDRQTQRLLDYCNAKGYRVQKIVKEIGSGLDDQRKKLHSILSDRSINLIVVEHKDRFCRFGMNYTETLLEMDGRKIELSTHLSMNVMIWCPISFLLLLHFVRDYMDSDDLNAIQKN